MSIRHYAEHARLLGEDLERQEDLKVHEHSRRPSSTAARTSFFAGFGFGFRLVNRSNHVQRTLRIVFEFIVQDSLAAIQCLLETDELACMAGELLGREKGLRKKTLEPPGAATTLRLLGNHISALQETLTLELPNLVQLDVSILSGLLAKELLKTTPDNLDKMFFCNSGTEAVEAAIKFARYTTKRKKAVR